MNASVMMSYGNEDSLERIWYLLFQLKTKNYPVSVRCIITFITTSRLDFLKYSIRDSCELGP